MSQQVAKSTSQIIAASSCSWQNKSTIKNFQQDLIKIVERASTISDRLSEDFVFQESNKESNKESKVIDARFLKWCQVVAKGNHEQFFKRLEWDELDPNSVRQILGNTKLVDRQSLPSWTDTLNRAMEIAGNIGNNNDIFSDVKYQKYQYLSIETPLPFEEIYLPFIEVAKEKLATKTNLNFDLISKSAYLQLQSELLKQLTNLFIRTLDLEFSLYRAYKGSQLVRLISKLQNNSSRQLYEEFVKKVLKDGLLTFFQEYSVLARLAATATDFWVETTAEFIHRLNSDWIKIQQTFPTRELRQVVAIETGLSDLHNCGRSVKIIQFTSGFKLVYKPKNLSLEQAYFSFLTWINQQDAILNLQTLKIINCSTHGWIEFIPALPCQDREAVKRYYQRAGIILCLVYALRGTDCHRENLIACGEQPVLIDLETLLHHQTWKCQENPEAIAIADQRLVNSVLVTALLPGANLNLGKIPGKTIDVSGLGNNDINPSIQSLGWENINTDSMGIVEGKIEISPQKNQPFGEDLDTSLSNYTEELIAGFKQAYNFLREHQELLLAPNSPLTVFNQQKVRIVLRNTQLYGSILQNSLNPKFMRHGIERSIRLDILSRALLSSRNKPNNWAMIAAERQALEQLDIPYITAYSNSNTITINSQITINNIFDNYSYGDVLARIRGLSNNNLLEQIDIIKTSLDSCFSKPEPK